MIISHKNRYVFVEIPHTGSHSIAAELIQFYGGERILRKHANLTQFEAQASRDERAYFVFGTVRNPLDTAFTDYSKLQSDHRGQFTKPAMLMRNGGHVTEQHLLEFEFVNSQNGDFASFMRKFRNRTYHNWFLTGASRYQFVLRFENLASEFERLIAILGLELARPLPHVNSTKKKARNFEDVYPEDLRAFVVARYGPFLRKWGYDLPASWGGGVVPRLSLLKFWAVDSVAEIASRHMEIDQNNKLLARLKRILDSIT